jgi:hypothetical protein
MIESVTQDFNETFATKADCTGFMARMICHRGLLKASILTTST